ncbi:MAG: hypothetical protein GY765_06120 [bacterium]|nr:hypothetical protein [bacterium]
MNTDFILIKLIAKSFYLVFILWGIVKCYSIAKRETTSSQCVHGLMFVLIGMALYSSTVLVSLTLGAPLQLPRMIMAVIAMILMVIGSVLAVQGLLGFGNSPKYTRGNKQAIMALILTFIYLVAVLVGIISGARGEMKIQESSKLPGTTTTVKEFKEFNFKYNVPEKPWVELNAKKMNPNAVFGLFNGYTRIFFYISADKMTADMNLDSSALVHNSHAHLQSVSKTVTFTPEQPYAINGVTGLRYSCEAEMMGKKVSQHYWGCSHNGYLYQLIAFCETRNKKYLKENADALFGNFSLLDKSKMNKNVAVPFGIFNSLVFNYTVDLSDTRWLREPDKEFQKDTGAEVMGFLGGHIGEDSGFVVTPILYENAPPTLGSLTKTLAATLGAQILTKAAGPPPIQSTPLTEAGMKGCRLELEVTIENRQYTYHLKILTRKKYGYMLAFWGLSNQPKTAGQAKRFFDAVSFGVEKAISRTTLADKLKVSQARLQNKLGLLYYEAKQYKKGIVYFESAIQLNPASTIPYLNLCNSYYSLAQHKKGLVFLEKYDTYCRKVPALVAWKASFLAESGQMQEAFVIFRQVFAEGYRNEDDFIYYITLLQNDKKLDRALKELQVYIKKGSSKKLREEETFLLKKLGKEKN